jgi:protein phosphatase
MAAEMGAYTAASLTVADKQLLRELPLRIEIEVKGCRFLLCHAIPSDPLFGYCEADSPQWNEEVSGVEVDVVLVGHTHVPAKRQVGHSLVINPGSVGQAKVGAPRVCYAIWDDGRVELKTCPYRFDQAAAKITALPLTPSVRKDLVEVLETGTIPEQLEHQEHV